MSGQNGTRCIFCFIWLLEETIMFNTRQTHEETLYNSTFVGSLTFDLHVGPLQLRTFLLAWSVWRVTLNESGSPQGGHVNCVHFPTMPCVYRVEVVVGDGERDGKPGLSDRSAFCLWHRHGDEGSFYRVPRPLSFSRCLPFTSYGAA